MDEIYGILLSHRFEHRWYEISLPILWKAVIYGLDKMYFFCVFPIDWSMGKNYLSDELWPYQPYSPRRINKLMCLFSTSSNSILLAYSFLNLILGVFQICDDTMINHQLSGLHPFGYFYKH